MAAIEHTRTIPEVKIYRAEHLAEPTQYHRGDSRSLLQLFIDSSGFRHCEVCLVFRSELTNAMRCRYLSDVLVRPSSILHLHYNKTSTPRHPRKRLQFGFQKLLWAFSSARYHRLRDAQGFGPCQSLARGVPEGRCPDTKAPST